MVLAPIVQKKVGIPSQKKVGIVVQKRLESLPQKKMALPLRKKEANRHGYSTRPAGQIFVVAEWHRDRGVSVLDMVSRESAGPSCNFPDAHFYFFVQIVSQVPDNHISDWDPRQQH